ncbi:hypothetical protein ACGFIW_01850 [Micromonospora sp. NPDC048935]|uniref:3'-5' exonuclease n=1 Tax=Micromonospora sp. NPDC048935 TaxID=3364262 RepID=UPI00370FE8BB
MSYTTTQPRVWLDTETTGLDFYRRPWEIALIVRRPGQPDIEHQWFIHPADLDLKNADPDSLKFGRFYERHPHGPALAAGADPWDVPRLDWVYRILDVLPQIAELTSGRAIIHGSNPSFDTDMLARSLGELGMTPPWHYHSEDVPGVARGWLLGRGLPAPRKSDDISRACGIDPQAYDRHSALGDCRWLRDLSDLIEPRTDLGEVTP